MRVAAVVVAVMTMIQMGQPIRGMKEHSGLLVPEGEEAQHDIITIINTEWTVLVSIARQAMVVPLLEVEHRLHLRRGETIVAAVRWLSNLGRNLSRTRTSEIRTEEMGRAVPREKVS